jgi:hypothetical protein
MKQKEKDVVCDSVLERMNYSNGSIIAKWQNRFPHDKPPSPRGGGGAAKKAKPKAVAEKPPTAIRLIQKKPVAVQINRADNPIDFDRMAFVIKAICKDNTRYFMCVLHVEQTKTGSRLVGTDGHRLHVADISQKIASGNYKVTANKEAIGLSLAEDDFEFPNWTRVVPDNTEQKVIIDLDKAGFGKDQKQTENMAVALSAFMQKTGETVNLRFLDDLPKKEWAVCTQKEKGKAMIFRERGFENSVFAVMMPISPEQVEAMAA